MSEKLADRCRLLTALVLDVDGVLTDGGIVYSDNGTEWKQFHVRDGAGLAVWRRAGKRVALITGRQSRIVEVRAAELGIAAVFQGVVQKLEPYRRFLTEAGLRHEEVCVVGDDLPDLPLLHNCGLAVAVADACAEVRADAHYVTQAPGGRGAVREVIELILRCQGQWQDVVERYRGEKL
jgi:3-deoxy-D-manno-octulosonate 8-phosphate phosphatase (KDO 8-P phosphatase)